MAAHYKLRRFGGHEDLVHLLLENGMDVNMQGGEHGSALQVVLFWGRENLVRLLLARKGKTRKRTVWALT